MVSDGRFLQRNKGETGNSSIQKLINDKGSSNLSTERAGVLVLRRSQTKVVLSRDMTTSPHSTQKSESHEKQMPPADPVERKVERIEKQNVHSSLGRLDGVKRSNSSSSLGSKQSEEGLSLSNMKWKKKKKKSLIRATMESGKAEPYLDGAKRMQMNAHRYRAIFKRKRMDVLSGKLNLHSQLASSAIQKVQSEKAESDLQSIGVKRKETNDQSYKAKLKKTQMVDTLPGKLNLHLQLVSSARQEVLQDVDEELEASNILSLVGSGDVREIDSEQRRKKEDFRDECSGRMVEKTRVKRADKASNGRPERCISSLRGSDVDTLENDINAESIPGHSVMNKPLEPPDGNFFKKSGIPCAVREYVHDTGRVLINISSTNSMEVPESISLTQLGRSLVGSMDVVNCKKHIYPNLMRSTIDSELDHTSMVAGKNVCSAVVDNASSSLHKHENDNLLGLCFECAEKRRIISIDLDMDEPEEIIAPSDEQRSLQQKQAPNDKVSGCEIKDNIKQNKDKCDKGMKKLVRQQWEEIQEFQRIWEEKRVQLENGYKLDRAFIRCIYGQGSMRLNKLKLLDEDIAKKIEEHEFLKDMNLKSLEEKQLAALKHEKEKMAYFLAKAKACCSLSVDEPHLLESQSEDPGHSQAIAKITVTGPENVMRSKQHIEEQSHNKIVCDLHGDDVMPSNKSVTVSAEAVGCTVPTETVNNLINIIPERRMGIVHCERTFVVATELPKELNPHGERVSDIIPLSEKTKEVFTVVPETVYTDIVGHGCSVESQNAPLRVYDKVHKVDLPENVMNRSEGADTLINGVRSLLPLEQTTASPDHCGLIPQSQVVQDECNSFSVSAKLQDQDARGSKYQSTTPVEETILEAVEEATSVQSNHEVIENCEQRQPVPAYISPGCNHAPASEVEHQPQDEARSASQIAEASLHLTKELKALSYQAPSQSGGNLELHPPVAHVDSTLDVEIFEPAEAVTSVQSNHEVIENCEQLHQVSAYVSPGCDQVSASEVEHQTPDEAMSSSQVAVSSLNLTELEPHTNQATTQSGGNLELQQSVAPVDSTLDVAILESPEAVTSIHSNHEVIGNREQLQQVSFYVSPGCDQVSASELEHQGQYEKRSSFQTAEASLRLAEELEALAYQANSQSGGNSELHPPVANFFSTLDGNHLDLGSANRVDNEPSGELNNSAVINVTMSEAVTSTLELPNQAVLQLGEDVTHLQGPSNLLDYPSHPVGSWNPTQYFHAKPLEDELHRLQKEREQVIKVHEDKKSQLKSDCKKEIQEIITQMRVKYTRKLQDAEAAYCLRKNELDNNYNKVFMHKILAAVFKSKCFNLMPSQHPGTQEAMQSGYVQNLNQPSLPSSERPSPEISACRPASAGHHTTSPNVQPVWLSVSHSTRPSNVAGSSSSQPVQPLQRGAALSHNVPIRPPHIGTLTPSSGNVRVSREIHAQAPHLQAFRPSASIHVASVAAFPPIVPRQRASVLWPLDFSSFSQHQPQQAPPVQRQPLLRSHSQTPQPVSTNPVSHGLLAPPSISLSTQEMRMDLDNQPQGVPCNVVYLSDDD